VDRRQIGLLGLTEEVTGDLVAWALLLLGVVFGLGTLGAVEEHWNHWMSAMHWVTRMRGPDAEARTAPRELQ
jgi:hypothetical protein